MKLILTIVIFVLMISLASAQFGISDSNLPKLKAPTTTLSTNYSTVNVNNSQYLQGTQWTNHLNGNATFLAYFNGANSISSMPKFRYVADSNELEIVSSGASNGIITFMQNTSGSERRIYVTSDENWTFDSLDGNPIRFINGDVQIENNFRLDNNMTANCYYFKDGSVQCTKDSGTNYTYLVLTNQSSVITGNLDVSGYVNTTNLSTQRFDIKGNNPNAVSKMDIDYLQIGNLTTTPSIFTMNLNDTKWGMRVGIGAQPDASQFGALLSVGYVGSGGIISSGYGLYGTNGGGMTADASLFRFYGGTLAYRFYTYNSVWGYNSLAEYNPNGNITFTNLSSAQFFGSANFYTNTSIYGNLTAFSNTNLTQNVYIGGNLSVKRPYGMYSSTATQTVAVINTPYPMTFNNTEDSWLITKNADNANFTFMQNGEYLIEISVIAQSSTPADRVQIWMQKNGANVVRSNTIYDFKGANANTVIAVPFILKMNTTDRMQVMYAGSSTNIILPFITNTSYSPETPSAIMTITKVSEIT